MIQIGARNTYNTPLLREVGRSGIAVLLKPGLSATLDEFPPVIVDPSHAAGVVSLVDRSRWLRRQPEPTD